MHLSELSQVLERLRRENRLRLPDDTLLARSLKESFGARFIDAASNDYLGMAELGTAAESSPVARRMFQPELPDAGRPAVFHVKRGEEENAPMLPTQAVWEHPHAVRDRATQEPPGSQWDGSVAFSLETSPDRSDEATGSAGSDGGENLIRHAAESVSRGTSAGSGGHGRESKSALRGHSPSSSNPAERPVGHASPDYGGNEPAASPPPHSEPTPARGRAPSPSEAHAGHWLPENLDKSLVASPSTKSGGAPARAGASDPAERPVGHSSPDCGGNELGALPAPDSGSTSMTSMLDSDRAPARASGASPAEEQVGYEWRPSASLSSVPLSQAARGSAGGKGDLPHVHRALRVPAGDHTTTSLIVPTTGIGAVVGPGGADTFSDETGTRPGWAPRLPPSSREVAAHRHPEEATAEVAGHRSEEATSPLCDDVLPVSANSDSVGGEHKDTPPAIERPSLPARGSRGWPAPSEPPFGPEQGTWVGVAPQQNAGLTSPVTGDLSAPSSLPRVIRSRGPADRPLAPSPAELLPAPPSSFENVPRTLSGVAPPATDLAPDTALLGGPQPSTATPLELGNLPQARSSEPKGAVAHANGPETDQPRLPAAPTLATGSGGPMSLGARAPASVKARALAQHLSVSRETPEQLPARSAHSSLGAGASRLVFGTAVEHIRAERAVAQWLGLEEALLFTSGYSANVGALAALLSADDAVFSDALNHASLIDGIRLSPARARVFEHLNLKDLEDQLARARHAPARWVITESYYSMDGDGPQLGALRALCDVHDAHLYVDEAHSIGTFGEEGRGLCAQAGIVPDVLMAGFGKALGLQGACVLGRAPLRTWLWNRARSFVFSTAGSPWLAGALEQRVALVRSMDGERQRLEEVSYRVRHDLAREGVHLPPGSFGPVLSVVVGAEGATLHLAERLREGGILTQAVRPPTVPVGQSRIRLVLRASLTDDQCKRLVHEVAGQIKRGLEDSQ